MQFVTYLVLDVLLMALVWVVKQDTIFLELRVIPVLVFVMFVLHLIFVRVVKLDTILMVKISLFRFQLHFLW